MNSPNRSLGFDREKTLTRWREVLLARESVTTENVRELEGHLRDGMNGLVARGLAEEEAFLIASRRLGGTDTLAAEFETVDPNAKWRQRAFWIVAGLLFAQFWFALAGMAQGLLRPLDTRVWWGRQPVKLVVDPIRYDLILAQPVFLAGFIGLLFLFTQGRLAVPLSWLATRGRDRRFLWICAFGPLVVQIVWRWRFWLSLLSGDYFTRFQRELGNHMVENVAGSLLVLAWPLALGLLLIKLAPGPASNRAITAL